MPITPLRLIRLVCITSLRFLVIGGILLFSTRVGNPTANGQEGAETRVVAQTADDKAVWTAALAEAESGKPDALERFCDALEQLPPESAAKLLNEKRAAAGLERQLGSLAETVLDARRYAASALGNPDYDAARFIELAETAGTTGAVGAVGAADETDAAGLSDGPGGTLVRDAALLIAQAAEQAEQLIDLRETLFDQYQEESRQGRAMPGTRLAWSLVRIASGGPETLLRPDDLTHTDYSAEMAFVHLGVPMHARLTDSDLDSTVRVEAYGYNYVADWSLLLQKPVGWIAVLAKEMRQAGVDASLYPEWRVMEGPGAPIAFAPPRSADDDDDDSGEAGESVENGTGQGEQPETAFFRGVLAPVEKLPAPADVSDLADAFLAAAKALHQGVMADESIPAQLRQALNPVLMGTYLPIDSRDYFDNAFCRRLIEADYLESSVKSLAPARLEELARYREALARVEAGHDVLAVNSGRNGRLVAAIGSDAAFPADGQRRSNDQVEADDDAASHYEWRIETDDATTFYSPLPERYLYAFMLAEQYAGKHRIRPAGVPRLTEVRHPVAGLVGSYRNGDAKADGSPDVWRRAVEMDARGGRGSQAENLVWSFPFHVLYRDDQGDPVLLATPKGVVPSPDFTRVADPGERRRAEDAWLDGAAKVLGEPGELGLIFHHFFRYCSDSPLPEKPKLIGSHYGLSDTHQTVYQSLERRWAGRLVGDCDDLAEFFQVLTRKQGKLSHVMNLPAHAAAGYAEPAGDGKYRFVVLQTGPVLQFFAPSLNEVVEKAYRSFDSDGGETHLTAAAVPILLRFADEDTRTAFVLSARIYGDPDYAESMIRVQEYWHKHVFSAGIREMEEMLRTDRELGSIKELGSLYERVGLYEKSVAMRREELAAAEGDPTATLSCLLDIAALYDQAKNKPAALAALGDAEELMNRLARSGDDELFARVASFRSYWAMLMAKLGEPERAWNLIRFDVEESKRQHGRVSEPVLRTLITLYDRMSQKRDAGDGVAVLSGLASAFGWDTAAEQVRREIDAALESGFFKKDDSYNSIISRYSLLGRYAVAQEGRREGLAKLRRDGPYPSGAKEQTLRGAGVSDDDWEWLRIAPRLYFSYGSEMLDRDEYPEFYDPDAAKAMLELVPRAVAKGTGLGSDISGGAEKIKSALMLAFANHDLAAFNKAMAEVRSRDFASLYDDSALVFGTYCGLVPLAEFPAWIEAFHEFFPGRQHYFKVVYRALDKEFFDHALMLAKATAGFFPDDPLLADEAVFVEGLVPDLKKRNAEWVGAR